MITVRSVKSASCSPQRGAALVELVLVLGVLFGVVALLVDLGYGIRRANALLEASRSGARYGAFLASKDNSDNWASWCSNSSELLNVACKNLEIDPSWPQGAAAAVETACDYMEKEGGFQRDDWSVDVRVTPVTNGDYRSAAMKVQILPASEAKVRSCILCFGGFAEIARIGTSSFMMHVDCP